jgi:hypothetical protein
VAPNAPNGRALLLLLLPKAPKGLLAAADPAPGAEVAPNAPNKLPPAPVLLVPELDWPAAAVAPPKLPKDPNGLVDGAADADGGGAAPPRPRLPRPPTAPPPPNSCAS